MKTPTRAKNSADALRLELGAKNAEIAAARKQQAQLKAKLADIKSKLAASNKQLKARFAKFGIQISENPSKEEIESALVVAEGYNIRAQQIAEEQAASLGFPIEKTSERLGRAFAACFEPKP
jgi:uncharacterized protein YigA (DUF484 family)